jgi:hypothetical protein
MTTEEVLAELAIYGTEQTKKTLMKHGAQEPFFGVKVQDLKKVLKKTKKNHWNFTKLEMQMPYI